MSVQHTEQWMDVVEVEVEVRRSSGQRSLHPVSSFVHHWLTFLSPDTGWSMLVGGEVVVLVGGGGQSLGPNTLLKIKTS